MRGTQPPPDGLKAPTNGSIGWVVGTRGSISPHHTETSAAAALGIQLFEGLLAQSPDNTLPRPGQAERYDVSPDGLVYTFHLRKNLRWSDGKRLDARDFVYSWRRIVNPATKSRSAEMLWLIRGALELAQGTVTDPATLGVDAPDPHTLKVTLAAPAPFFPHLVATNAYAPVPRHAVDKRGKAWAAESPRLVVNGPFRLGRPVDGNVTLVPNKRYWDAKSVKLKRVVVYTSSSSDRNWQLYRAGKVHIASWVPLDIVRHLLRVKRSDLHISPNMCTYYYYFRTDRGAFADRAVRLAFHAAVDRRKLIDSVLGLRQSPAHGLLPDLFEGLIGYRVVPGTGLNAGRARELMAEAGYSTGKPFPETTLFYNGSHTHRLLADGLSAQLADVLGARVRTRAIPWKQLLQRSHRGDFDVVRTAWCADYPDPATFLEVFRSTGGNNYGRYTNPTYDRLLDRIQGASKGQRNRLICAAEKVLQRDAPILPLYTYTQAHLVRPFVRGWHARVNGEHLLKYVSVAR